MRIVRRPPLRIVADADDLRRAAGSELRRHADAALAARGRFTLALSGGRTPASLYGALGRGEIELPWHAVHLFWGDERDVPPDDDASNYGMVRREMLARLAVPPASVHPIPATGRDANRAALSYEDELREFFALQPGERPRFDVVLLGLGGDGHTASLFPGSPALGEGSRLVTAPWVERFAAHRITVTLPVLNAAHAVLFLVAGEDKAAILARAVEDPAAADELPARAVEPADGELLWLVDRAAASRLGPSFRPSTV
jgi:6-phosphogluconolactonase